MLTPPALANDSIIRCLSQHYSLDSTAITFLPLGADVNTAVYRVATSDGRSYFLKLRQGDFDEVAVAVPAFLQSQGVSAVMAPIPTASGKLWVTGDGFHWIVYPFWEGDNGFNVTLTPAAWRALGRGLRAVHATVLPAVLRERIPCESYDPRWREIVRRVDHNVGDHVYADPLAADFAVFWRLRQREIHEIVDRAEQLGRRLAHPAHELVLCHADLHAGNVLVGSNNALAIVDWDNPILAPKERDLMFIGAGVGNVWHDERETALFYEGYGPTVVNSVTLSYYRYERIVEDLAAYADQLLDVKGSIEDREEGLRQISHQFLPQGVVDVAHRTYRALP